MAHEGRMDEYAALLAKYMADDPSWGAKSRSSWKVMADMGYKSAAATRKQYQELVREDAKQQDSAEALESASELEQALLGMTDLPHVASPSLEMEWVRGHPAMMRKDLMAGTKEKIIRITPADILAAPHGLPPSRSAVSQLISWVNRPAKFNEQLLGVNKKSEYVGDMGAKENEGDLTMQEVRELISQFAGKPAAKPVRS
jgi:hypothetical protein